MNSKANHLRRRLRAPQIFFIALGGVVGIGFFNGPSKTIGIAGPVGAFIATFLVGLVAIAVMDGLCELISIWPIPNAMVEFLRAFVDEDLGTAVGILYCYTYCITFSALIIAAGDLSKYWNVASVWIYLIYAISPLLLAAVNCAPVDVFGWIEFAGGVVKLALVLGTFALMCVINAGAASNEQIGSKYFVDMVKNNPNVAANHFTSISVAIPLAIFAYIGVEIVLLTAYEARDEKHLQWPARNIAPISFLIYCLSTGVFAANVAWDDPNLNRLFQQALVTITEGHQSDFELQLNPDVHAAPLITLLRAGWRFLPGFLNACFIYSALSCANTALYASSRQLYGLTRAVSKDHASGLRALIRSIIAWAGGVDTRTGAPWPAIWTCTLCVYWLPFIHLNAKNVVTKNIQDVLGSIGSVSALLVWFSQCMAYICFNHWRVKHINEIQKLMRFSRIHDRSRSGYFQVLQPGLAYFGALGTFLIVFLFNHASMWNGQNLKLKATSAFLSPAVLVALWICKKLLRPRSQWRIGVSYYDWPEFETKLRELDELAYHGHPRQSRNELNNTSVELDGPYNKTVFQWRTTDRSNDSEEEPRGNWTRANLTFDPPSTSSPWSNANHAGYATTGAAVGGGLGGVASGSNHDRNFAPNPLDVPGDGRNSADRLIQPQQVVTEDYQNLNDHNPRDRNQFDSAEIDGSAIHEVGSYNN